MSHILVPIFQHSYLWVEKCNSLEKYFHPIEKFKIWSWNFINWNIWTKHPRNFPSISTQFVCDTTGVDEIRLTDFVGKYTFEGLPFEFVNVSIREAGKIHLEAGDRIGDVPPIKDKPNVFETPEAMLTFVRDEKNQVVKLIINTGDTNYESTKVERK